MTQWGKAIFDARARTYNAWRCQRINVWRIVRSAHLTPLDVQTRPIIESELMINFACKWRYNDGDALCINIIPTWVPNKNTFRICDERTIVNDIIDANANRRTLSVYKAANFE